MSFDNEKFTHWLVDFEAALIECGMPQAQAMKFRGEYFNEALAHFAKGESPMEAACSELLS
jgi:truncated hemoglobin YjbI